MKGKDKLIKSLVSISLVGLFIFSVSIFTKEFMALSVKLALFSLQMMLPTDAVEETSEAVTVTEKETTTEKVTEKEAVETLSLFKSFTTTPDDIKALIKKEKKLTDNGKKKGNIREKTYRNEGVTDKFSLVRMKNVNRTKVSLKNILNEKIDLSVTKKEPSVLIFHTHTTETYPILEKSYYTESFITRSNDKGRNMVRVGEAIVEEIENAGFTVIHDKEIHDSKYTGAYGKSRESVEAILKKYPSIQVVLDIHRDAIQDSDGTKVKPTATVKGKKAAQIMIISGCQEEGNPVKNLPDWRYNLTFAVHLQQKLEELFEGITRPLYFCPRSYNMNVTHCSLLLEVGSDSNTLEEAVYTGK
ncbi:MAG: stage II sporulation protein P, partial [Clostridia bacterium]|nr:stage II sporulation protein P [Clostridia bacterium]